MNTHKLQNRDSDTRRRPARELSSRRTATAPAPSPPYPHEYRKSSGRTGRRSDVVRAAKVAYSTLDPISVHSTHNGMLLHHDSCAPSTSAGRPTPHPSPTPSAQAAPPEMSAGPLAPLCSARWAPPADPLHSPLGSTRTRRRSHSAAPPVFRAAPCRARAHPLSKTPTSRVFPLLKVTVCRGDCAGAQVVSVHNGTRGESRAIRDGSLAYRLWKVVSFQHPSIAVCVILILKGDNEIQPSIVCW